MLVTEFGMVMLVRPEHPEKALPSMLVTEFGMIMLFRPVHPEKALPPMLVTEFGIIVFMHPTTTVFVFVYIIALQLSRESNIVFPDSTIIVVSPKQPSNALYPISVTEFGIVMLVRPEQPENA